MQRILFSSRLLRIAALALCAVFFCAAEARAENKTITIAADVWCPINCASTDAQQGIGIELARKIFEPMGYAIRYTTMPWARALVEVRAGTIDAAVGANRADDPNLLFPQNPIYVMTDDFYVLADNPLPYTDINALQGKRLGIIKDYGYGPLVTAFLAGQKQQKGLVEEVGGGDALDQNIRKLLAKRIDVIIESAPVMDRALKRLHLESAVKRGGGAEQGPVYLAFSPALARSHDYVAAYDAGIAKLKSAEILAPLYQSYGLTLQSP